MGSKVFLKMCIEIPLRSVLFLLCNSFIALVISTCDIGILDMLNTQSGAVTGLFTGHGLIFDEISLAMDVKNC
jgi:hypothetical protein